ncbi:MAG: hypothetical protein DWQ02_03095 [Bacteroidetes bacterium]|nr:MAG: hypothetical protein DWQ02_03095 [Bacteroidota bacterium]
MSNYVPKNSTKPIRTGQNKSIYILGAIVTVLFILWGSLLLRDMGYIKLAIILTPLLLLLFREGYRRSRRNKIQRTRFTSDPPYAWNIQTTAPFAENILKSSLNEQFTGLDDIKNPLLFLVEKKSEEDHQAHLYDLFIESLLEKGIDHKHYYHSGDLQFFWNDNPAEKISLEKIQENYGNYALIICGDAHRAVNPSADELQWWTFHFYNWKHRFVLTNRSMIYWDYHENVLSSLFAVLPFSKSGIVSLGNQIKGDKTPFPIPQFTEPKDQELDLEDISPEDLENYFGKEVTQWIASVALCSRLDWDMTLKIGHHLTDKKQPLLTLDNIQAISRLTWFRHDEIPDKERQQLEQYLDANTRQSVRQILVTALEEHPVPAHSHAHNNYRMELAGLKGLIPNFAQKGIKNELYELKSIGYQEDQLVTNWIDDQKWWIDRLIPKSLERVAYNEGFFLLGRSFWFFIPLLLIFGIGVSMVPDRDIASTLGSFLSWESSQEINNRDSLINAWSNPGTQDPDPVDPIIAPDPDPIIGGTEPITDTPDPVIEPQFISGNIMDVDKDKIPDGKVSLLSHQITTGSDNDGTFQMELPIEFEENDMVSVLVSSKGYHSKEVDIRAGRQNYDIVLIPKEIEITVEDGDKKDRLENALVIFSGQEKETNRYGKVVMQIPPDLDEASILNIRAHRDGFNMTGENTPITKSIKILMYKIPLISISGKVQDEEGRPIDNVIVHSDFGEKRTDSRGRFSFSVPENNSAFESHFEHPDYLEKSQRLYSNRLNTIELESRNISLTFRGKVIDRCTQKPLYYARVKVQNVGTRLTNRQGEFSFQVEVPKAQNTNLEVEVTKDEYHLRERTISRSAIEEDHRFSLRSLTFFGTVVDQDGNLLSGATINLPGIGNLSSGNDGKFSVNVPTDYSCSKRISVSKGGYKSRSILFKPGDQITLERDMEQLSLTGIVEGDCDGDPLHRVKVKLSGVGTRYTDTDGRFRFEMEVPKGTTRDYELTISKDDFYSKTLEIRSNNLNRYPTIKLSPSRIKGKVLEKNGTPVVGAKVKIGSYSVDSGDGGHFSIRVSQNYNCQSYIKVTKNGFEDYYKEFLPGRTVRLSRIDPNRTTIIIKAKKKINNKYVDAAGAQFLIEGGLYSGNTSSNGERKITIQRRIGQEIRIYFFGTNQYNEQFKTVELTGQNQVIKFWLSTIE